MHTLAKTFAEALYELDNEQKGRDQAQLVAMTIRSLKKRGMLALFPRIVSEYEKMITTRAKSSKKRLILAHEKDARALHDQLQKALFALNIERSELDEVIDTDIIGGFQIEAGTKVFDASFKTRLLELYRSLAKA